MSQPELLVLIGPMGAGKSTIGKLLASEVGYEFLDSDRVIEERSGADIPWIFDVEGEQGFRDRETSAIKDLSQKTQIVLATGGGAMMRPENRDYVSRKGFVVYLKTSVEQQYQRTHKDKNRPLLQDQDRSPYEILESLMSIRDPLYRDVADLIIETDKKSQRAVVNKIIKEINKYTD